MFLSIDPENLKSVAQNALRVNADIDSAMQLLNQISAHNDWNCKERKQLNEYTVHNKNKIRILKENSDVFLNAVQKAAQDFQDTEKNLSTIFASVDDVIRTVLSVTPNVLALSKGTEKVIEIIGGVSSQLATRPNVYKLAKKGISVVKYSDINLKGTGK